jgi:hypothetical protein
VSLFGATRPTTDSNASELQDLVSEFAFTFTRRDVAGNIALFAPSGIANFRSLFIEFGSINYTVHANSAYEDAFNALFATYSSSFMTLSNVNSTVTANTARVDAIGFVARTLDDVVPIFQDHVVYEYYFSIYFEAIKTDRWRFTYANTLRNATKIELDNPAFRFGSQSGPSSKKRDTASDFLLWTTLLAQVNRLDAQNARAICNSQIYQTLRVQFNGTSICDTPAVIPQIVLTQPQICIGGGYVDASCLSSNASVNSGIQTINSQGPVLLTKNFQILGTSDIGVASEPNSVRISLTGSVVRTVNGMTSDSPSGDFSITGGPGISISSGMHGFTITNIGTTVIQLPSEFYFQGPYLRKNNQSANTVWAGPAFGSGVPTFRNISDVLGIITVANGGTGLSALQGNHVLFTSANGSIVEGTLITGNGILIDRISDTVIRISVDANDPLIFIQLAVPSDLFTVVSVPITQNGTLEFTVLSQLGNQVWASPANGAMGVPAFRYLVEADIPSISATTGIHGVLPVLRGGTNNDGSSFTGSRVIMSNLAGNQLTEATVTGTNGIQITSGPGALLNVQMGGICTTEEDHSCVHKTPTLTTLSVTGSTVLGNTTTCVVPLNPSCLAISSQSCPLGALSTNCIPKDGLELNTLTVGNLVVLNTTTQLNVDILNGTAFTTEDLFVAHLHCTSNGTVTIPQSCYDMSGAVCSLGTLDESCIPNNLVTSDLQSTGTLTINALVCTQPVPENCLPVRIRSINGVQVLDFSISAGNGTSITTIPGVGIIVENTGVLSIGISAPASEFIVSNSPVTSGSGTIAITKANQPANYVWAGPTSGSSAQPTFRPLVYEDLPPINATLFLPSSVFVSDGPLSASFISQAARTFFASNGGVPAFRTFALDDLPAVASGQFLVGTGTGVNATSISIGLSVPSNLFVVTNSPITQPTGTISVSLATQIPNTFFAGPASGNTLQQPTFRPIGLADFTPMVGWDDGTLMVGVNGTAPVLARLTAGANTVITNLPGQIIISSSINASQIGTVMSVALDLPNTLFSVSGSPVTMIGTLSASLISQLANKVFASPDGASGTPSFRSLLFTDLPTLLSTQAWIGTGAKTLTAGNGVSIAFGPSSTVFSVTVTLPASVFSVASSPGLIDVTFISQTAKTFFAAPNGASGVPSFRTLVASDLPALGNGQIYIGSTGTPTVGSITAGTLITVTPGPGTLTIATTAEANTASNVNVGGVGVFKQKSGADLQFRGINAGSSKVTITNDAGNNEIDVDVSVGAIDHNSLLNFVANKHIDHSLVSITAGTGLTGGGTIAATRTISLANTAVTAGTYGSSTTSAVITVDAQGRITSATNTAISGISSANVNYTEVTSTTATSAISIASGTVVMTGMTSTPASGTYMATFSGYATITAYAVKITIGIYVDGVLVTHSKRVYDVSSAPSNVSGASPGTTTFLHMSTQAVLTVTGSNVVTVQWSVTNSGVTTFAMLNNGSNDWFVNRLTGYQPQILDPVLFVNEGGVYTFTNGGGASHPLSIKTTYQTNGSGNRYTTGVVGTPATTGNLVWTVAVGAPTVLYYQCENHNSMSGSIVVMTVSAVANERSLELIKLS